MKKQTYFISYTTRTESDVMWAKWIEYILREIVGGETIMQEYDSRPGDNFKAFMDVALKEADIVVCVLTRSYMESNNCRDEWTNAERIIPVKCDDCELEGLLKSRVYIKLHGLDRNAALETLLKGLQEKTRPDKEPEFPAVLVTAALEEPTFPRFAINNLPDRNRYFAGREVMLSKIASGLKKASTVVIAGQGGFGKTQAAIEYAYLHKAEYDHIWCFNAGSEVSLQDDYRDFAIRVVGRETARTEEFAIVRSFIDIWLSENTSYLFIYDDAEGCPDLSGYLPKGEPRGDIIINTRERLEHINGDRIDAEVFTLRDAVDFLEKRVAGAGRADSESLASTLGCLPLALEQAAAYIIENKRSIKQYLGILGKQGLRVLKTPSADTDYDRTVLTTWVITFDKLEKDEEAAPSVQLLRLLAYCAPDDIPLKMFIDGRSKLPQQLGGALDPEDIVSQDEIISRLQCYSLVTFRRDERGDAFLSMHRLMQEVIVNNLGGDIEYLVHCLDMAVDVFDYEYGTKEDFDSFAVNLPHALEIAGHTEEKLKNDDEAMVKAGRIYHEAGFGLNRQGDYARALEWYYKALVIKEKVLGMEHPNTATTYNNIAIVFDNQGEYAKALEWYQKALAIKEKVLGLEHPSTATTYDNIATVYSDQGDYASALEWHYKALAIREKVLGLEHPSTATTYNNIAGVYHDQGDYARALEWYYKALVIKEKVLGMEHPSTATTYNNIALVYSDQGDYARAQEWYYKALAIKEKVLGAGHPSMATTYNNIALVYGDQGEYGKALEWYFKALAIKEKVLGEEHPSTATTYNNIAAVYYGQGEYGKALEWYKIAYRVLVEKLGEDHPSTKTIYSNAESAYNTAGYPGRFDISLSD